MGDLSENGLYKAAKMELGNIDRQIRHFQNYFYTESFLSQKIIRLFNWDIRCWSKPKAEKENLKLSANTKQTQQQNKISIKSPIGHN